MADTPERQGVAKVLLDAFQGPGVAPFTPRVYWERLPSVMKWDGETILFEGVGGVPIFYTEGAMADKRNARVQINVWATHPLTRDKLVDRLMEIAAAHPTMTTLTEADSKFDSNVEQYYATFDLSVWWDRNF